MEPMNPQLSDISTSISCLLPRGSHSRGSEPLLHLSLKQFEHQSLLHLTEGILWLLPCNGTRKPLVLSYPWGSGGTQMETKGREKTQLPAALGPIILLTLLHCSSCTKTFPIMALADHRGGSWNPTFSLSFL